MLFTLLRVLEVTWICFTPNFIEFSSKRGEWVQSWHKSRHVPVLMIRVLVFAGIFLSESYPAAV